MGFWKIVGGIAAGVGTVAMLPVAGAVGAVTITGALIGGAVGAAVAASTDDEDEKKRLRRENETAAATCAEATSKAHKIVAASKAKVKTACKKAKQAELRAAAAEETLKDAAETIESYRESLKDVEAHYQLIIALTAVGMAAAKADGVVAECETGELDEYISGVAATKLPAKVKARIKYLHNHPPTFEKAMNEVVKLGDDGFPYKAFRTLIVDVINADGVVDKNEMDFLNKWDAFVKGGMIPIKATAKKAEVRKLAVEKAGEGKARAKKMTAKKMIVRK